MRSAMYHIFYGNDAPAWATAAARALVGALITASLSCLGTWSQTNDPKLLIISFMVPFLSIIGGRGGIEGAVDTHKERKAKR